MKFFKVFIITLLAFFLTGCYTQLQYSQTMKKVTDKKPTSGTSVYSWSGEEEAESSQNERDKDVTKAKHNQEVTEEYIPIYYKDYEYATKYGDVYNFYGNDWYGYNAYPYYGPDYTHLTHSFFYDRWLYHSFYDRWYRNPSFYFSITFGWGTPYYRYNSFYGRHYDPYFDYYLYGNFSPFAYNYFYGRSGYGYGYWPDKKKSVNKNVKYGPRTIGTNRVDTDKNRSRVVNGNRSAAVTNRTSSTVRTRSVGTTRTRGTSSRSTVNRTKSRDNSSSSRSRTRGQDRIDNNQTSRYDYRNRGDEIPLVIDEKQLEQIRARIRDNNRNNIIYRSRINNERERTTFFNRMKNFFEQNGSRFTNGNNGRTLRTRSSTPSTRRSKINRSSSSNRSSVTRSKSSSSNSRSRGSSSSSRSRSDNSSSSSSDRSRGN